MGIPRHLKGRHPSWNPGMMTATVLESHLPLMKRTVISVSWLSSQKWLRHEWMPPLCHWQTSCFLNKTKSNARWLSWSFPCLGWYLKPSFLVAIIKHLERYSMQITNNNGDKRSHYLSALPPLKYSYYLLLRLIVKMVVQMYALIHLVN